MRRNRATGEPKKARFVSGRILAIGPQGDGVLESEDGRVFVARSAPGDVVTVEARGARGEIVKLHEPGPDRAPAVCIHYERCGGCAFQHIAPPAYRRWKEERLIDALARAGVSCGSIERLVETPPATRRRATFAALRVAGAVRLGFNARRSGRIEPVEQCAVLHPGLRDALPGLGALGAALSHGAFDLTATFCENGIDVDIADSGARAPGAEALASAAELMRRSGVIRVSRRGEQVLTLEAPFVAFDGLRVGIAPGAFLQASREGEAILIGLVKEALAGAKRVADLFSGCGTFSLPVARSAAVFAFDASKPAIAALAAAARAAQGEGAIRSLQAASRDLVERPLTAGELSAFDAVVFDPPRAGALKQAEQIAASDVPLCIAVSCNPATFARDAATLLQGGFDLERVVPVDQFVYAPHLEVVGVFRKRKRK